MALVHILKLLCNNEGLEVSEDHLTFHGIEFFLVLCQVFNMKTREQEVATTLRAGTVALQWANTATLQSLSSLFITEAL